MRIAVCVSAILVTIGLISIVTFSQSLFKSAQDYRTVNSLAQLAEARTSWIDGTVDLSLERSVTQVALALSEPAPAAFVELIAQQRTLSEEKLEKAQALIKGITGLKTQASLLTRAQSTLDTIRDLRGEVDQMLSVPSDQRPVDRINTLPDDLKANITKLKNLSELMRKSNRLSSSHSASIAAIQDRAWEVREFGGRARTYYAIATLTGLPIPSADQTRVQLASKRAASAWGVLTNQLETFDAPADLTSRTSIAEQVYFEDYLATIDRLNTSMQQSASDTPLAYPISFEQFFELSNGALRQMSDLSKNAGLELNTYWTDRSDAAWNSLIVNATLVVFVLTLVGAAIWFIRSRVTSRLEAVTKDLVAVAEGKLETSIDNRSSDLAEVKDLIHSLHDLTNKLQQAETSNQERLLDQQMQGVVMETLSEGLQQLSNGNLGHQIAAAPAERYAALYDNFNKSCSRLRSLVGSVVQNSNDIDGQVGQVNGSVSDMARRTEQQAASFKETVSALSNLSTSVTSTAEVSMQTDIRVTNTKERAQESGEVVDQAVAAMREIKASSDQVTQIIGLIDDIAFQTNLLALNAGVEAARSGEAGRGFAVVASEVRALAQRSAEAAKEISELISTSSKQVENGVSLVTNAGTSLTDIVEMVEEISGLVSGISASSKEQATSLSDVSSAMVQLDQVTQQNNTMVHEVSNASEEMIRSSTELSQSTSQFSLGSQVHDSFETEPQLQKSA